MFSGCQYKGLLEGDVVFFGEFHLTAVLKFVLLLAHHVDYMQSSLLLESCCYIIAILV